MRQYTDLLEDVLINGTKKEDRTGTGTLSVFGRQMRFNLQNGFPLVTTKKVHLKSIIHELLWFLSGDTNVRYLQENGVKIWDEWADESGELGPVYGSQWRSWPVMKVAELTEENLDGGLFRGEYVKDGIDQIQNLMDTLKNNPDSRRIIVSAWNVAEIEKMKLPPCHAFFQFYTEELTVRERLAVANDMGLVSGWLHGAEAVNQWFEDCNVPKRKLSCQLYQRSADLFLGVPFNIASYALLIHMVAQQANMVVGDFIWSGGDVHIYSNHVKQVKEQLYRTARPLPTLNIKRKPESIFDYKYEDFELINYNPHPPIKAPVAV